MLIIANQVTVSVVFRKAMTMKAIAGRICKQNYFAAGQKCLRQAQLFASGFFYRKSSIYLGSCRVLRQILCTGYSCWPNLFDSLFFNNLEAMTRPGQMSVTGHFSRGSLSLQFTVLEEGNIIRK